MTGAADRFERAVTLSPRAALAEDASFWRAVALTRAHRRAEAIDAFSSFIARFASSPRRGEAEVTLGELRRQAGQRDTEVPSDSPKPSR